MGTDLQSGFDRYTLRARLLPALIVVLPVGLSVAAWFPSRFPGWGILAGMITAGGFAALLAQLARDQGKKKESDLFAVWGGCPTTRMLRHCDTSLNSVSRARFHKKLKSLIRGLQ